MPSLLELLSVAPAGADAEAVPAFAQAQRARSGRTVVVLDVAVPDGRRLHWLDSDHARGWMEAPPEASVAPERNARFEQAFAAAAARGFVGADAALLAAQHAEGALPRLSWGESAAFAYAPAVLSAGPGGPKPMGIYALVDSAERMRQVVAAGVTTVQLRIKTPAAPDPAWHARLREEATSCIALARDSGCALYINDHWQLAAELGAFGVHLGQEDLLALGEAGRSRLLAAGVVLGISSHSVWELCRARALAPGYIACGPVWATTTKDMPWVPQGLDNLAWWCRMAQAPVVAIGGILEADQVRATAACGADGVCIVRGLGAQPQQVLPALHAAFDEGRRDAAWPHPSLPQ